MSRSRKDSTVVKRSYAEKLKDPRWQKKRLEIMQRADFTCESCGCKYDQLFVHHRFYKKGCEPWEYPDGAFLCLCDGCHKMIAESESVLLCSIEPKDCDYTLDIARMISNVYGAGLTIKEFIDFADGYLARARQENVF